MHKKHDHTPTVTPQPSTPVPTVIPRPITPSPVIVDEPADVISDQLQGTEDTPEPPSQTTADEPMEITAEPVGQASPEPPVQTVTVLPPDPGPIVTPVGQYTLIQDILV